MRSAQIVLAWLLVGLALAAPAGAVPTVYAQVDVPGDGSPQRVGSIPQGDAIIRVSGMISESFEFCDSFHESCKGTRTVIQDALYCFDHSGYSPPDSPEYCSTTAPGPSLSNWLQFEVGVGAPKQSLYDVVDKPPSGYRADHTYTAGTHNFTDNGVVVSGSPGLSDTSSSGSIHVEFLFDVPEGTTFDSYYSGDFCGSAMRAAVPDPVRCLARRPAFGRDLRLPAPAVGSPTVSRSPNIPRSAQRLVADARLAGAAPGPLAAIVPLDDLSRFGSGFGAISACVIASPRDVPGVDRPPVTTAGRQRLTLFLSCARAVDSAVELRRATAAAGCELTVAAVPKAGRRASSALRFRALNRIAAALGGSCVSGAGGHLRLTLNRTGKGRRLRPILGGHIAAGFVRASAPSGTDGSSPQLLLRWGAG
jgi:hypothetical protein